MKATARLTWSLAATLLSRIAHGDESCVTGANCAAAPAAPPADVPDAPEPTEPFDVMVGGRVLRVRGAVDFGAPEVHSSACYHRNYASGSNVTTHLTIREKVAQAAVVRHVCDLDVSRLRAHLEALGDEAFLPEGQATNADMGYRTYKPEKFKPGVRRILLVFSTKDGKHVYRFPWLADFLPVLQETVFGPLKIRLDRVMRMQLAQMTAGATINPHFDKGEWARKAHRVHVPIITHGGVTMLVASNENEKTPSDPREFTQIPSVEGTVYEVNNIVHHAVTNEGGNRVHLIVDWLDDDQEVESVTYIEPGMFCVYRGGKPIECARAEDGAAGETAAAAEDRA